MSKYKVIYAGNIYNIKASSLTTAKTIFFDVLIKKNRLKLYSTNSQNNEEKRVVLDNAWSRSKLFVEKVADKEFNIYTKNKKLIEYPKTIGL
jgi:hypothetical protein